jgi:carboxyl-terminal processing protease
MAQELTMNRRGRLFVLAFSIGIIAFAVIGGFMSRAAAARQDGYQSLAIFDDVVTLITNNYVEDVDMDKVMKGAMHGLADGLDPDSAFLDQEQVTAFESGSPAGAAQVGLELTRQYYLRVIAARDGSPAARAGLLPGDYIRAIDGQSTRDTSVFQGMRMLAGKPGTDVRLTVLRGNAAEPHDITLTREALPATRVTSRSVAPGVGLIRVPAFGKTTADEIKSEAATLSQNGATRLLIDLRGTAFGETEAGLAAARLFVPKGTLAFRQARGQEKEPIATASGDGTITQPVVLLTDRGTSGAAELFASALHGNTRATLVGERTLGRAARQKLVKLPDGSGLLLTNLFYLAPGGGAIHEKGLTPDVAVDSPDVEFGQAAAEKDPVLEKAIESFNEKKAA